jgi:hypothetical protein
MHGTLSLNGEISEPLLIESNSLYREAKGLLPLLHET